jgi:hypothetical protein
MRVYMEVEVATTDNKANHIHTHTTLCREWEAAFIPPSLHPSKALGHSTFKS